MAPRIRRNPGLISLPEMLQLPVGSLFRGDKTSTFYLRESNVLRPLVATGTVKPGLPWAMAYAKEGGFTLLVQGSGKATIPSTAALKAAYEAADNADAAAAVDVAMAAGKAPPEAAPVKGKSDPPVSPNGFLPDSTWHPGVQKVADSLTWYGEKPSGAQEGAIYQTPSGTKIYVKWPSDPGTIKTEVLTAQLARATSVYAPDIRTAIVNGKPAVLSPWLDGAKPMGSTGTSVTSYLEQHGAAERYLAATFPFDIWVANYDVVGPKFDNLLASTSGLTIWRIDFGGALYYTGFGASKVFSSDSVFEDIDTMLLHPKSPKVAVVFVEARKNPSFMLAKAKELAALSMPYLEAVCAWAGVGLNVAGILHSRAQTLLAKLQTIAATAQAPTSAPSPVAAKPTLPTVPSLKPSSAEYLNGEFTPPPFALPPDPAWEGLDDAKVLAKIKTALLSDDTFEHNGAQFYAMQMDSNTSPLRWQLLRSVGVACADARMFVGPENKKFLVYPTHGARVLLGLDADAWLLSSAAKQVALAGIRRGVAADLWLTPKNGPIGHLFGWQTQPTEHRLVRLNRQCIGPDDGETLTALQVLQTYADKCPSLGTAKEMAMATQEVASNIVSLLIEHPKYFDALLVQSLKFAEGLVIPKWREFLQGRAQLSIGALAAVTHPHGDYYQSLLAAFLPGKAAKPAPASDAPMSFRDKKPKAKQTSLKPFMDKLLNLTTQAGVKASFSQFAPEEADLRVWADPQNVYEFFLMLDNASSSTSQVVIFDSSADIVETVYYEGVEPAFNAILKEIEIEAKPAASKPTAAAALKPKAAQKLMSGLAARTEGYPGAPMGVTAKKPYTQSKMSGANRAGAAPALTKKARTELALAGIGPSEGPEDPRIEGLFTLATVKRIQALASGWTKSGGAPGISYIPSKGGAVLHKNPRGFGATEAAILDAVGLPLGEVNGLRRNPARVDAAVYAGLSAKMKKVVDLLVPAILAALPGILDSHSENPRKFLVYDYNNTPYDDPQRTLPWNLASEINLLLRSVWRGDVGSRPERTEFREQGKPYTSSPAASYLRILVIARALGMWRHILDPGHRIVYRGGDSARKFIGDSNGSFRMGAQGLQQVQAMGALGDTFDDSAAGVRAAILRWLKYQSDKATSPARRFIRNGFGGSWTRALISPYSEPLTGYNLADLSEFWTTYQNSTEPIPGSATGYASNIEGFYLDFYPQSFKTFTTVEFSSHPFSYGSQKQFMFRARASDPRFVFLPAGTMNGGMSNGYTGERAVLFVAIDDTPLAVDVVYFEDIFGTGTAALTEYDVRAYHEARPSYPVGAIPEGPAKPLYTMLRNPGGRRASGTPSLRRIGERLQDFVLRKNPHDNAIRDCAAALGPQRAPAKSQPRVTFLMGPAGSGKSTWAQLTYARSPKSVILDSDLLKKAHPQWTPGTVATPELHQWSVATQEAVYRQILAEAKPGDHVVYDGTGSWAPALAERIAEARSAGWFIEFAVVLVPLDVAIRRVGERVGGGGHGVPEWKIREQAAMVADTFCQLAPMVDRVVIADNSKARKIDESGGLLARSKRLAAHIVSQAMAQ